MSMIRYEFKITILDNLTNIFRHYIENNLSYYHRLIEFIKRGTITDIAKEIKFHIVTYNIHIDCHNIK